MHVRDGMAVGRQWQVVGSIDSIIGEITYYIVWLVVLSRSEGIAIF